MGSKKSKQAANRNQIPMRCCELIVCDCPPPHAKIYGSDYHYEPIPYDEFAEMQQTQKNFQCREREQSRERERCCRERSRDLERRRRSIESNRSRESHCYEQQINSRPQSCQRHDEERHVHFQQPSQSPPCQRYRTYYAEYNDLMNEAQRKLDSVTYNRLPRRDRRISCSSISSIDSF